MDDDDGISRGPFQEYERVKIRRFLAIWEHREWMRKRMQIWFGYLIGVPAAVGAFIGLYSQLWRK